jgi:hypothetical protein
VQYWGQAPSPPEMFPPLRGNPQKNTNDSKRKIRMEKKKGAKAPSFPDLYRNMENRKKSVLRNRRRKNFFNFGRIFDKFIKRRIQIITLLGKIKFMDQSDK